MSNAPFEPFAVFEDLLDDSDSSEDDSESDSESISSPTSDSKEPLDLVEDLEESFEFDSLSNYEPDGDSEEDYEYSRDLNGLDVSDIDAYLKSHRTKLDNIFQNLLQDLRDDRPIS